MRVAGSCACLTTTLHGGVGVNVAGREPRDRVRPDELPGLVEWLEREFLRLREPDTGPPGWSTSGAF